MKNPGSPEKIFIVLTLTLLLSGLGFMIVGLVIDHQQVVLVGRWVAILGFIFAFLPLVLFLVVLAIEKLHR
jgi:hypothetical protein